MRLRVFLLFLTSLWFVACTEPSSEDTLTLAPSNQLLTFPIDSITSNISNHLTYFYDREKDVEYLFSVNRSENAVQIYDFKSRGLYSTLKFDVEGPKGAGRIKAVLPVSLDSLFVFPIEGGRFSITDANMQEFKRFNYTAPEGYGSLQTSIEFFASLPYFKNNKLYSKAFYQTNWRSMTSEKMVNAHLGYALDITNGDVSFLNQFYPDDYFDNGLRHFNYSAAFSSNGFVYSFFGDHNLYYSKEPGDRPQIIPAKSKYMNNILPVFPSEGSDLERASYYSARDHYGNLFYDQFREVYYRFCFLSMELDEMETIMDNLQNPRDFSIQVFDKSLDLITEKRFANNYTYLTKNAFVGKKGLYISNANGNNERVIEDEFSFTLLELMPSN